MWALGATLYAAVEGRPPFAPRPNPIALLQVIASGQPEPMEHAGPIGGAIAAMMDPDPSRRWDMATAAERLARVARGEETLPLPGAAGAAAAGATQVLSTANEPTQAMPAPAPAPAERETAPAAAAAAYGSSRPAPGAPEPGRPEPRDGDRAGARRWLPLLLALLLVGGLGGAYLLTQGDDAPGSTSSGSTTSTGPTTAPEQTTTSDQPSPTSEPSTSTSATTPPETSSSTTTQSGRSDRELAKFVRDYFKNVTKDRDKTWPLLTPEYQDRMGGRQSYDGFWSTIESVKVGDLEANAEEGIATAQLTYQPKDGSESTERHELTVVESGDGFLIADDSRGG
jgi:hypothetical protein